MFQKNPVEIELLSEIHLYGISVQICGEEQEKESTHPHPVRKRKKGKDLLAAWISLCTQWSRDATENEVEDPHKCPICGKCVAHPGTHFTMTHAATKENFKCTVDGCERVLKTKNARTGHLENDHGSTVPKPFHCHHQGSKCGPFQKKYQLQARLRRKHQAV